MVLWPGYCPTHIRIETEDMIRLKREHPQAKMLVHPECRPEVIAVADEVLSTSGMCRFANSTEAKAMIICTEIGIIHRLRKENPDKKFAAASEQAICLQMKLITLEKVLCTLEEMAPEVKAPPEIRLRARAAVLEGGDCRSHLYKASPFLGEGVGLSAGFILPSPASFAPSQEVV